jgi:hypothetical protein
MYLHGHLLVFSPGILHANTRLFTRILPWAITRVRLKEITRPDTQGAD